METLRRGDLLAIRNERWRIVRHIVDGGVAMVEAVGCSADNRAATGRFLLPFEPVRRLTTTPRPRLVRAARWRHTARRSLADAMPSWASLIAATRADLRLIPFQLEPVLALLHGRGCRFLIADEVGLGKTVEAGLMIAETLSRNSEARALVICPSGLREQWRGELAQRFGLVPAIFDGYGLARAAARLPSGVNPWAVHPLVVTSIDFVKRPEVMRALERLTWDITVLDEVHNLAGRSDRAAAAEVLGRRTRVLVAMTATPHSGDDRAFERLCALGRLADDEPLVAFRRTRADAGIAGGARARLLQVRTTSAEAAMHEAVMAYGRQIWRGAGGAGGTVRPGAQLVASLLARRASSSAAALARSISRRLTLLPSADALDVSQPTLPFDPADGGDEEPSAVLGIPGLPHAADERHLLEQLLQLAQTAAASESKIEALRRILRRTGDAAIVFTEFRDTLERLARAFPDVETVQLHGALTPRERHEVLRLFNNGAARLLLATDAGSEGLNLHHRCRLVINLELPWTPLRLEQRAGRVDRLGQTRPVHVIHLVGRGTCEHDVLARLASRIGRARGAMHAFASLPDEHRIAASVFGGAPDPRLGDAPSTTAGIVTADLRDLAEAEAHRLQRARVLLPSLGQPEPDDRPPIVRRRRRPTAGPPQCIWAFTADFTSREGVLLWQTLIPLAAALRCGHQLARPQSLLDPDRPALRRALSLACAGRQVELRTALRTPVERWRAREQAIAAALRADHGRLAASLLQGSLFTRSEERLAAAQAQQLDEALDRCRARLAELDGSLRVRLDACGLRFGVVLE